MDPIKSLSRSMGPLRSVSLARLNVRTFPSRLPHDCADSQRAHDSVVYITFSARSPLCGCAIVAARNVPFRFQLRTLQAVQNLHISAGVPHESRTIPARFSARLCSRFCTQIDASSRVSSTVCACVRCLARGALRALWGFPPASMPPHVSVSMSAPIGQAVQVLRTRPEARLLLCAPTPFAADILCGRLADAQVRPLSALCPLPVRSLSALCPPHFHSLPDILCGRLADALVRPLSALYPPHIRSLSAPCPTPVRPLSAGMRSDRQLIFRPHLPLLAGAAGT